jgi:hypothetical protein
MTKDLQTPDTKRHLQRLLELSYLYCWGTDGKWKLRDEWRILYYNLCDEYDLGEMDYVGQGEFKWY